jgi:hypothetical protein
VPVSGEPRTATGRKPRVAVEPAAQIGENARLFESLEAAFAVRFVPSCSGGPPPDGLLAIGEGVDVQAQESAAHSGVPMLALAEESDRSGATVDVRLHDDSAIDRRLRGVVLHGEPVAAARAPEADDWVLATAGGEAVWTRTRGGGDRVGAVLPRLGPEDTLRGSLRGETGTGALGLVTLVHFLRGLQQERWSSGPLRAAFVFDDPNLRRTRYGYIDYASLVRHADLHDYHCAMAMVPLDARACSAAAVAMFRARRDRLSLVFHGNDHVRSELMQPQSSQQALRLGAQALRRIERFELRTGLRVDRVMMPPHGMCSRVVTESLGALGFGALCAIHPCPWTEQPLPERLLAGWTPAEFIDGCAVIPRFPLSVPASEIALRAFLEQPLVLYGHHDDLSGGLEPLAEATGIIHRLGAVRWCALHEIMHANYQLTVRERTVVIRPWAGRLQVSVPSGATALRVEAPPVCGKTGLKGWSRVGVDLEPHSFNSTVPLGGESDVAIRLHPNAETDPRAVPDPPWRPWPHVRRRAAEARDRLAPTARYGRAHRDS